MADVLTVISGNGGMGKSFFACNIACGLVTFGKRVLLVEGCFGTRADDVILSIKPDKLYTIGDVTDGTCEAKDAVTISSRESLPDFISASHHALHCNPLEGFKKIIAYADDKYDYVIFDTSSASGSAALAATKFANKVFVLTDDSFLSIRNSSLCVIRAKENGADEIYTVVNNITSSNGGDIYLEDIIDETGAPLLGIIPYDEHVRKSLLSGDVIYKYNTYAGRSLENICRRILGESVPDFETGSGIGFFQRNRLVLK